MDTLEGELAAYRDRCEDLEDRVCDLRLELARLKRVRDEISQHLDWNIQHAAALQQNRDELAGHYRNLESHYKNVERQYLDAEEQAERLAADRAAERSAFELAIEERTSQIQAFQTSWSWRLTTPLRWIVSKVRGY